MKAGLARVKASASSKLSPSDLQSIRSQIFAAPGKPDVVVGVSLGAIQKFLDVHYLKNPKFYDRSRQSNPNAPIYDYSFNDHGKQRRARFWAKIEAVNKQAVVLSLLQDDAKRSRFRAWWKEAYGVEPDAKSLPPNVKVTVPRVILQLNFPKFDGGAGEHQVDIAFRIEVEAYLRLVTTAGKHSLQLINWDISIEPLDSPADPDAPIWGPKPSPECGKEIKRLRLVVRDLITIGGKIALTQLATNLTVNMQLPPLDVVKGLNVAPHELTVTNTAIALGFVVQGVSMRDKVENAFKGEIQRFYEDLGDIDIGQVISNGPFDDPKALDAYMRKAVPAYSLIDQRLKSLTTLAKRGHAKPGKSKLLPNSELFIMVEGGVFDLLAKTFLRADEANCTEWLTPDLGIVYGQGRACCWFNLINARGALNGTTISMGADLKAGGRLELRACIRIPCAPDKCGSWSPGLGLAGPCDLSIAFENKSWDNNQALRLKPRFAEFPGFEVYGLPPGISNIANAVLNFLSSVVLKAFFNAILSVLNIYLVQVPVDLVEANMKLKLSQFAVANDGGYLVLTGATAFS